MDKEKPSKKGFMKRLRVLARDRAITHGSFRALVVLMLFADNNGKAWPAITTLSKASGISAKGLTKILPSLERIGYLRIVRKKAGDSLPNGKTCRRNRSVYVLAEVVCGVPRSQKAVPFSTEPSSTKQGIRSGEPSSSEHTGIIGEPGSTEQVVISAERTSHSPVNQVPVSGELGSSSLRDRDLEIKKNDPDRIQKRFASLAQRFLAMSATIRSNTPIDPGEFVRLVNEAQEDKISLPKIIGDTVNRLEQSGRIEKTRTGNIDRVFWHCPTALSFLLENAANKPEFDFLISETAEKVRI